MLQLPDSWVWDMWLAEEAGTYHMYFLYASRAIAHPDLRHFHAGIGHAVSTDLSAWTRVEDALVHAERPAFDDLATWTGSVIRGDDRWYLFYTGVSLAEGGLVQRIGVAVSDDLFSWTRVGTEPVAVADGRWYEKLADGTWPDEAWRDPWILRDAGGDGWHMLVTARANQGAPDGRGVIGHARSSDLLSWEVLPPLTDPGCGFGQLEVPQVEEINGQSVLVFSCLGAQLAQDRSPDTGGIWITTGRSLVGPWDIAGAERLSDESLYSGRLVRGPSGWVMLAFDNLGPGGSFGGTICDPIQLSLDDGEKLRADGYGPGLSRRERSAQ